VTEVKPWTVAEAKDRLSEVIGQAVEKDSQTTTRNGSKAVVVVAIEEWERKTSRKGTLADFFAESPLRGSGVTIERDDTPPREIDL
jgi:prevent-host-death family protein